MWKQASNIACATIRMIFCNPKATKETGKESLAKWYGRAADFDDAHLNAVAATAFEREDETLNYFINKATNVLAKSLNSKIKKIRAELNGMVDVKFFLLKLTNNYA
ncbi:MAG: transposase [Bacteroidaceae bacterium]|nr:transposase [Bacteroidaceae bacterium]